MNYGEWTIICLWTLALVFAIFLHDTPKSPSKHNFYVSFFGVAVNAAILYWAGLFRNI